MYREDTVNSDGTQVAEQEETGPRAEGLAFAPRKSDPDWLAKLREENWQRYNSLPMPNRTDEKWRFSNVRALTLDGYHTNPDPAAVDDAMVLSKSDQVSDYAGRLVFADERQLGAPELAENLIEKGVVWCSLEYAILEHSDLVEEYFLKESTELGAEKFEALHAALNKTGAFLYVPDDVEIEKPFVAYHWVATDRLAVFPHTIVVAGKHAQVKVNDIFVGENEDSHNLAIGCANLFAGPGSRILYKQIQEWNCNAHAYHLNTANADRDARIRSININLGAAFMRHEHHTRIEGPGSNIETYSLSVPSGEQEYDQRTLQTHLAPNAKSDLLFKNALHDDARTIFSGLIRVEEHAQQTDAFQTNRNLLVSPTAEANALPGLEIKANDVKCSHGATTGQIDDSNIFYFLSRGISVVEAKKLLVFGFFEEIIEKLDDEALAQKVREYLDRKLS